MAAPNSMTTMDLSGRFVLNKKLSDDTDKIFQLQGLGWFIRSVISAGTITLNIKHYKDDADVEHIDIDQTVKAWITQGTTENRTLDWTEREYPDRVFGDVLTKSRRLQLDAVEGPFLKGEFTSDVKETGVIMSSVKSDTPKSGKIWDSEQTWGFEIIDDARHYVRRVNFSGPNGEIVQARLVYDFVVS